MTEDRFHPIPNLKRLSTCWRKDTKELKWIFLGWILIQGPSLAIAGNCVIQGNQKIGDCSNVDTSSPKPLLIKSSGSYSGIYSTVVIKQGGIAYLSGIADSIRVESGGVLFLSGISRNVDVFGAAEISGKSGWVTTHPKSIITISGIADGISGSGSIKILSGSIVGGVYKK